MSKITRGALELHKCFKEVPKRCFDVGMAEQHAVTLAAGFSVGGMKPIVCFQSTFFQRAFDQLVHDICVNKLPVLFILARSGLAGLDHTTHHAPLDLSYLSCVPNLKIFFPIDHIEFNTFLENISTKWINGPTILLFPYGTIESVEPNREEEVLLNEDIFNNNNVAIILSTAGRIKSALKLKKILSKHKINFAVLNIFQIKPLDRKLFTKILKNYNRIVTMEENVTHGGLGSAVCEFASDNGYKPDIIRVTLGDVFVDHGTRPYLYKKYNIDENSILEKIKDRWDFKNSYNRK